MTTRAASSRSLPFASLLLGVSMAGVSAYAGAATPCDRAQIDTITDVRGSQIMYYAHDAAKPVRVPSNVVKAKVPIAVNAVSDEDYVYFQLDGQCVKAPDMFFSRVKKVSCPKTDFALDSSQTDARNPHQRTTGTLQFGNLCPL